jgi:hypothetical protein
MAFTLVQKIWTCCIFTFPGNLGGCGIYIGPENVDQFYFFLKNVPRKSGDVVFTLVQKIWTSCILTFPGNLVKWYYCWSRNSGPVAISRCQKIWGMGLHVVFSSSQGIWGCGLLRSFSSTRKSTRIVTRVSSIYLKFESLRGLHVAARREIHRRRF